MSARLKSEIRANARFFVGGGSRLDEVEHLLVQYAVRDYPTTLKSWTPDDDDGWTRIWPCKTGVLVSNTKTRSSYCVDEDKNVETVGQKMTVYIACLDAFLYWEWPEVGKTTVIMLRRPADGLPSRFFYDVRDRHVVSIVGDSDSIFILTIYSIIKLDTAGRALAHRVFEPYDAPTNIVRATDHVFIQTRSGDIRAINAKTLDDDDVDKRASWATDDFLVAFDRQSSLLVLMSRPNGRPTTISFLNPKLDVVGSVDLGLYLCDICVGTIADGRSILYAVDPQRIRAYDLEFIVKNLTTQ